jgi:hypothetical protein
MRLGAGNPREARAGEERESMRLIACAAAAAALAGTAQAQAASGMTLDEVAAVLKESGFAADVSDGAIYSATNGFSFALYGYNCGAEARCNEFLFSASFEAPAKVELATINKFNSETLAGRAYLDGAGEPNVEHLFTVDGGDADLVERNLAIWDSLLMEFATAIGYFGAATS